MGTVGGVEFLHGAPMTDFAQFIVPNEATGCWIWCGSVDPDGYGRFSTATTKAQAHRAVYEQEKGPIPDGLELDHLCLQRRCVNPAHLEPVTHAENMRRALRYVPSTGPKNHRQTCSHGLPISRCRGCRAAKDAETYRTPVPVFPGDVWSDSDRRSAGRTIRVLSVEGDRVLCEVLTMTGGKPPSARVRTPIEITIFRFKKYFKLLQRQTPGVTA